MGTEPRHPPFTGWSRAVEWQFETARVALEGSIELQQSAVDGWTTALGAAVPAGTAMESGMRRLGWGYDLWAETLRNVLVHFDDAVTSDGVDLDTLGMIWLHAMDDAFSEVMGRPSFAAASSETLERTLREQQRADELRRAALRASNLPTDRDVAAVGERLLGLEASQKRVEEKLDAVLEATEVEPVAREVPE